MPARLSLTKAQRDALLVLPDTEEAFVRHYSLSGEDSEITARPRIRSIRSCTLSKSHWIRSPS